MRIPGLKSTAFLEFLKGEQKNCNNREGNPVCQVNSCLCWSERQKRRSLWPLGSLMSTGADVQNTDWRLTSATGGQRGQNNYIRCIHHLLAWGVCAFPPLINILRVRLAVRVFLEVFLDSLTVDGFPADWPRLERGGKIMTTWFKKMFS